jgi:predicted RNA-binding Zn-ribbon protein involved in translation (DUF1610 family)
LVEDEGMDFVCPSCGAELPEDTSRCPSCGLDLDIVGEPDYECPDCGAMVPHEARDCPSCGAQFILDEAEDEIVSSSKAHGGAIDEMLEAAVKETIVTPKKDEVAAPTSERPPSAAVPPEEGTGAPGAASDWVEEVTPEAVSGTGEEAPGEGPAEAVPAAEPPAQEAEEGKAEGTVEGEAAGAPEAHVEAKPRRPEPEPAPATASRAPAAPRRYAGGFTLVGLAFVILAGVALVLTIIALRWDAISSGSKYEAIGSMQSLVILLGLAAFVFCAVVSVYDLLRGPKGSDEKSDAPAASTSR